MKIHNFFAELKRRNVYKVAIAYAVIAWLLIQAASIVLPTFEAPAWTMKVLLVALTIGLPIAIVLAWAFEITPEGIKLEKDVAPNESITRKTGRKLVAVTIVLLVIAVGLEGLLANPRAQADAQSYLALVYAGLGQKEAALESGRRVTESLPASRDVIVGGSYLVQLAMVEAQVGEKQSALDDIEQLLAIPAGHALSKASLRADPVWDPLRGDPRFQKLYQEKKQ